MNQSVVNLSGVTKRFREVTAVKNIDLSIKDGELLTLLGPSGCGKTTTLRMIAGFETASEGSIEIDGQTVTGTAPYNRDTGMVFQQYALFPHMTVSDNVAFGLEMQGRPQSEIDDRVSEVLQMVRLDGLGGRYPKELSGGQQQRVALARALVIEPSVLLLDEPLSNLDKKLREEMQLEILRLHRELDVSMVYVTHNQEEALTISDRMVVMNDGEIHQIGTPEEVYQSPNDEFVADFIGNANLIDGTVDAVNSDGYAVSLETGDRVDLDRQANDNSIEPGQSVTLLFRPERFHVEPSADGGSIENQLSGTVLEATYLGSRMEYFIEVGNDQRLHVAQQNLQGTHTHTTGERINLGFDRESPFIIPRGVA
ncbi:ABC transporter ATP-binding protein [Haladaptatus caseinilyticus]|uniref:ABC transporter ATP-binding protein n=1 Tax=Haladaptatus caseinilyticus TaxID=2993314 RepID=UPI00224B32C9|nr:ABC transporter ATP-binding protein [Haladaptatus caseinilyticus]